ncbi:hypothetical protein [Bacillus sp. AFS015802]|uniref:hypothetical protein n=1 Tax=Bacillus sp. AFS015802 TaxID=2033486 RepID=UPI0015CF2400|nr:hypothetical protein [Bacillus sp. AFS015802]
MGFWMWIAIFMALAGGILAANSNQKQTERKYTVALFVFILAVIVFFFWWFTDSRF